MKPYIKSKIVASEFEQTCALQHLFCHEKTNNQSYYDVDFDNLRIAHKRNIVLEVNTYYPYGMWHDVTTVLNHYIGAFNQQFFDIYFVYLTSEKREKNISWY